MTSDLCQAVDRFEALVRNQEPIPRDYYDEAYYSGAWRGQVGEYTLEQRRSVEGPHPRLIAEVFEPHRVLDAGCGPGVLLALLDELGIRAEGVDASPNAAALAPRSVKDRVFQDDLVSLGADYWGYDLVICREVLEHLTALQVRRAVTSLCRASTRFVYVTTRFAPKADGPFALASETDVDPTHITLLSQELLRCLFVLEGFARRADLERRLDWAGKKRVLVYERPGAELA